MPDWLSQRALASPRKPALVFDGRTLDFTGLDAAATAVAARLRSLGVAPGDRVALLAPNSDAFARAVFGISRAGAVLVPLNTRLSESELAWQLEDCEPSLLVAASAGVRLVSPAGRAVSLEDLVAAPEDAAAEPGEVALDAPHSIIYTSGTTGRPKGAVISHGNFLWNAFGSAVNLGVHEDDRWLACMPLFHVGGLSILLRGVLYGTTVEVHESFDAAKVNEALCAGEVSLVSLVPTMMRRMLDSREGGYHPRLRCVLLGGGPVPLDLTDECLRRGIPIAPTYGLTEAASQVTTLPPSEGAAKPGSAGKPLLPVSLRILRDDGATAAAGEAGEIAVRGPTVTSGYWRRPEATAETIRDGWLRTGDYGYVDDEGFLYVVDRREDLIVSGGENVYPAEVEALLESHPQVREAGVFALPDPKWGQQVAAAVVLQDGAGLSAAALQDWCRGRLAGFKVPKTVLIVTALPRTASGKLLRRELRAAHSLSDSSS